MKLAALLERHQGMDLARPDDGPELLELAAKLTMTGSRSAISYDRHGDYFRFMMAQGSDHKVFVYRARGRILGTGTLIFRPGLQNGVRTTVGFLADLRITPDRQLIRTWRNFLSDLTRSAPAIPELHHCTCLLTAILAENEKGRRALTGGNQGFIYEPVMEYAMTSLLWHPSMLLPIWPRRPLVGFQTRLEPYSEDLESFLCACAQQQVLGFDHAHEHAHRSRHWPGFDHTHMVVCRNTAGEICGVCNTWNPSPLKAVVFDPKDPALKLSMQLVNAARSRDCLRLPVQRGQLEIMYLTPLEISPSLSPGEQRRCFHSLLSFVLRPQDRLFQRCHMLSFLERKNHLYLPAGPVARDPAWGLPFVVQRTWATAYHVRPHSDPDRHLSPGQVGLELATI